MSLTANSVPAAWGASRTYWPVLLLIALFLTEAARAPGSDWRTLDAAQRSSRAEPRGGLFMPRGSARASHQGVPPSEVGRAKAAARREFTKSFGELQQSGYTMLREHEAGQLKPSRLSKHLKSIQKSAKSLRALLQLGEPAPITEVSGSPQTPQAFDESIRRLTQVISAFAHNPIHQNSKVFNTGEATRARTDLAVIIALAKLIESQARQYTALPTQATIHH